MNVLYNKENWKNIQTQKLCDKAAKGVVTDDRKKKLNSQELHLEEDW
jgi:hypothetical protein